MHPERARAEVRRARAGRCELAHERGARGSLGRNGDVRAHARARSGEVRARCARAACARKSKGGGASERCVRAGEFLREHVNGGTSSGHHIRAVSNGRQPKQCGLRTVRL